MKNPIRTITVMISFACASLLVAGLSLTACDRNEDRVTTTKGVEPGEGVQPRAPADVDQDRLHREFEETRREFTTTTKRQLDELDRNIQELDAKVDQLGEDAKKEVREDLDKLKEQRKQLADRLDRSQQATRESWEEFKRDTQSAWNELEQSYNRALERMKTDDK
jgi:septal ring factor EnvC (AmiA/AmiB activator)